MVMKHYTALSNSSPVIIDEQFILSKAIPFFLHFGSHPMGRSYTINICFLPTWNRILPDPIPSAFEYTWYSPPFKKLTPTSHTLSVRTHYHFSLLQPSFSPNKMPMLSEPRWDDSTNSRPWNKPVWAGAEGEPDYSIPSFYEDQRWAVTCSSAYTSFGEWH